MYDTTMRAIVSKEEFDKNMRINLEDFGPERRGHPYHDDGEDYVKITELSTVSFGNRSSVDRSRASYYSQR